MLGSVEQRMVLSLAAQGSGAETISAELGYALEDVKLVLNAYKSGAEEDRDITDTQLSTLRMRAYTLALQDSDLGVSARMTQFLIERDKPKEKQQTVSPLVMINNAIVGVRERFDQLKDIYSNKDQV